MCYIQYEYEPKKKNCKSSVWIMAIYMRVEHYVFSTSVQIVSSFSLLESIFDDYNQY